MAPPHCAGRRAAHGVATLALSIAILDRHRQARFRENALDSPGRVYIDSGVRRHEHGQQLAPSRALPGGAAPGERARHRPHDVRLLVPGDDGVQRHQADHALEVHLQPRRRQPPLRPARGGPADRRADAGLQRPRGAPAPPLRGPADPRRDVGAPRRLLVPVPDGGRLGLGGLLPARPHPRPAPDQPVLDPRQRHLRRAAGQARLRLHRRRVEPGRHDRRRPDRPRREPGGDGEPAALQRGDPPPLRRARHADRPAGGGGRPGRRRRRRGGGRRRQGGLPAPARVPPPPDHRPRDRLRRGRRRPHRAAAQHGGGGVQGALRHRQPDRVPGPGHALPLRHRLLHPGRPHEPDPPLPGRGLRAARAPDEPGRDRPRHAPERRPLGPGPGPDPRHVAALHARQDHPRGPVPPAADRASSTGPSRSWT